MTAVTATHPAVAGFNLSIILASPQPSIPLHPKPLLHSLAAFQAAVDAYVHKGKQEIGRRKEAQGLRLNEDADRKREMEEAIEREKRREIELIEVLEKERLEAKEMESSLQLLKKQLASLTEQASALDGEANDLRMRINRLRKDKSRDISLLQDRAQSMSPQLALYEGALGFSVTGVKDDILLFKFMHLEESAPTRLFSFVLDLSQQDYIVTMSEPPLGAMPRLVDELNNTRQFWTFIKGVRAAFLTELEETWI
ncbi:hypothetical protein DACRYDRAFT_101583 [Dacryopinax primogenitus]|uniref:Kinetochore protein SPC25 n=1 Tax=Dacryopinax primogenitus (strain DJM 731) TaxID=1858805 RepID=M5G5E6_DACPD|nr:uncharacterized protein DACRYDRAFT_101583 [Dacryopinax primogenitus]EJT98977.1 hypothetical protein DACRYDRAFT_101583 [Dacryopinax primogenitus]